MTEIVIASAARTPVGSFNGAFASLSAHALGTIAIKAAMERAGVKPEEVDEVILGQILTAGAGQNPARQAAVAAGIPVERTAFGINQLCGSGLRAVALAAQQIATGDADDRRRRRAGEHDPGAALRAAARRAEDGRPRAGRHHDQGRAVGRLPRLPHGHHGRERGAQKYQLTREEQDEFAAASQRKAGEAMKAGRFKDEIAPVTVKGRKGDVVVSDDEYPKPGDHASRCCRSCARPSPRTARSRPAMRRGINDGAAARGGDVGRGGREARHQAAGAHRLLGDGRGGPSIMGTGPIPASRKALQKAGWDIASLDLIEANEAFAAQACAVNKDLGWDPAKVNVNGGAIALGHPIGAVGRAGAEHAAVRDAAPRRQARPGDAVHRRRHGRRDVRRARGLIQARHAGHGGLRASVAAAGPGEAPIGADGSRAAPHDRRPAPAAALGRMAWCRCGR